LAFAGAVVIVVMGCLLAGAMPALAAPGEPSGLPQGGMVDDSPPGPGRTWRPAVPKPEPVTLPGTHREITPFASPLEPTRPTSLPGTHEGTGLVLQEGGPAAAEVRRADPPLLRRAAPAGPDDPAGGLFCSERVTQNVSVSGSPNQLAYAANLSYLAELGCNFFLSAASISTGVIDRGRFDGDLISTTPPVVYGPTSSASTSGAVSIPGELYDGGRNVEIAFELYLQAPNGIPWGGCFPIPGLRYLQCDGLGTDLLHIVLGTGTIATGLTPPVIRYVALGDSYSSGTGAPPYSDARCRRSPVTYSNLLAGVAVGDLRLDRPVNAACHGAVTDDLYSSQVPGVPAQLDAVRANTRLVTLTMGGNDLGFSTTLGRCTLTDCARSGPLVTAQQLTETRVKLTAAYRQIRSEMHNEGRVKVLSYPAVLPNPDDPGDPQPTRKRCPGVTGNLSAAELRLIYGATARVDKMIRDAVIATGDPRISYVNGLELLRGHRVCSSARWTNGFTSPLSDSFHPNAAGYRAMASQLRRVL
jgi:lysophospholipase L1-like esterase